MKSRYIRLVPCLAAAALLTSCSENAWNDHLDGFEAPAIGTDVQRQLEYVLTADDYKAIADLGANKNLAQERGETAALAAIKTNCAFASADEAHIYLPNYLGSSSFQYFTLDSGSSINVTFAVSQGASEQVQAIDDTSLIGRLSEADYKAAWGSDTDFINGFAPACPASYISSALPSMFPDAARGDYALVDYNWSDINPVFTTVSGGEQDWTTKVLGNVAVGQEVKVKGIVTGICSRGFILTDRGGSILCYQASGYNVDAVPMYSKIEITATVSSYGTALQLPISDGSYSVVGEGEYEYPEPVSFNYTDVSDNCGRSGDYPAEYISFTATCSISGNYVNFLFPEGTDFDASAYMIPSYIKAELEDGERYTITGWFVSVSAGKHLNVVITGVQSATRSKRALAADVAVSPRSALYQCQGGSWSAVQDVTVLQPYDYTLMGLSYDNFSSSAPAADYLPTFLAGKFPYAAEGDVKTVAYKFYGSGATTVRAAEYILMDGKWVSNVRGVPVTEQFVKSGTVWNYDPSVTLVLPVDKGEFSKGFYQACVDWVYETKCVPLGDTSITSGLYWVTSYGNNEYWSGTSAYQTNVDIRPAAARNQYAAGFEGMDDEQVKSFIMGNFVRHTLPAILPKYYPTLAPVEGINVTMTVIYGKYDGKSSTDTAYYNVTAPATFEYSHSSYFKDKPE